MSFEKISKEYLDNLGELFKYLKSNSIVAGHAQQAVPIFSRLHSQIETAKRHSSRNINIDIDPNLHFEIDPRLICSADGKADLFIGGQINFENNRLKDQVLIITITFNPAANIAERHGMPAMTANRNYVVRRFHFDFDSKLSNGDRPLHHFQYGGDFDGIHMDLCPHAGDGFEYELIREMDHPRLPIPPADPGSLLDAVLHQFGGNLQRITADHGWIKVVSDLEKILLKNHYESALQEINKASRDGTLYTHFCKSM